MENGRGRENTVNDIDCDRMRIRSLTEGLDQRMKVCNPFGIDCIFLQ